MAGRALLRGWPAHLPLAPPCTSPLPPQYLHSKHVVHLDVKSSNVLLTLGGTAKLAGEPRRQAAGARPSRRPAADAPAAAAHPPADVGLSRLHHKTFLSAVPSIGTFAWSAPEILIGGLECTPAVDVYSYGVLLWVRL